MSGKMIDFDSIDEWHGSMTGALRDAVPASVIAELASARFEYVEDACQRLLGQTDRASVVDATLRWISSSNIAAYHATRLDPEEVECVRSSGLHPLVGSAREKRLRRALSCYANWFAVEPGLHAAIAKHAERHASGVRVGQVHATLSKSLLTRAARHYLTHGSEFDQAVAQELLDRDTAMDLLARDGKPMIVCLSVPGAIALERAHPYLSLQDLMDRGDLPNIISEFLRAWSFRLSCPSFQPGRNMMPDVDMVFDMVVPAEWICLVEEIDDQSLHGRHGP
jgi:hypothetical protein